MSDDVIKYLLGEGGWGTIDAYRVGMNSGISSRTGDIILPYTSASLERTMSVPFVETANIPWSDNPRSKIRLGKGVYTFSGSISFEYTKALRDMIFSTGNTGSSAGVFCSRNSLFDLVLCDTEKIRMKGCSWTGFSLSCTANSLVTGDLSFQSLNLKDDFGDRNDIHLSSWSSPPSFADNDDHELQSYWRYGVSNTLLFGFSINFSRNVEPVFLNNKLCVPSYLRVGMLNTSITLNCVSAWFEGDDNNPPASISLGDNRRLRLLNSYQSSKNYTFRGLDSIESKTYTIEGSNNSTAEVFDIITN